MNEEEIAQFLKEKLGEDIQIFAVIAEPRKDGNAVFHRIADIDEGYIFCMLGAVEDLKVSLLLSDEEVNRE